MTISSSKFVLNRLNLALLVIDVQQNICWVNVAAEELLGHSSRQLVGSQVEDWVQNSEFSSQFVISTLLEGKQFNQRESLLLLNSGKSVKVDVAISQFEEDSASFLLIELNPVMPGELIMVDEKELDQHRQTQQLLGNLAHEIRNPLGGLRGAAQLLSKQLTPEQMPFTDIIIREADRMNHLIERVLGAGKPEHRTEFNIHQIIEEVLDLIEMDLSKSIQIKRDYDPSLPEVSGFRSSLFQALLNLIRNSVQALSIDNPQETDRAEVNKLIRLSTRAEHGVVIGDKFSRLALKIDIFDNGPGVPDEIKDSLFVPMVSGQKDGTGLGLSIARAAVEKQGGVIQWKSHPQATCFSIYLPVKDYQ